MVSYQAQSLSFNFLHIKCEKERENLGIRLVIPLCIPSLFGGSVGSCNISGFTDVPQFSCCSTATLSVASTTTPRFTIRQLWTRMCSSILNSLQASFFSWLTYVDGGTSKTAGSDPAISGRIHTYRRHRHARSNVDRYKHLNYSLRSHFHLPCCLTSVF